MIGAVLWPIATIALYFSARALYRWKRSALTLPIVVTAGVLIAVLLGARADVVRYVESTRVIAWWLGPATVALAVPLHRERARLRVHARAVGVAVATGALTSIAAVLAMGLALRVARPLLVSLVPKSVTTPIAMPIAERLGGVPAITAAVVVITGLIGMVAGPRLLDAFGVRAPIARGLAMGTATHGIGTARALTESPIEGAMSGVAMVISGVVTVLLAPIVVRVVLG